MENLVIMNAFHQIYKDKTVLVTGHSGFKGSWLCRWLEHLGAKVVGLSLLDGVNEDHHKLLQPSFQSISCDIRDFNKTKALFNSLKPDAVFHLAAQALVIDSYHFPVETYATNVMGTLHVLEAARSTQSVKACVIVTSDKCYENNEWIWGYRENDPFGGHDMYSSSKGCAELLTQSFRRSFGQHHEMMIASARAGNVIGGGDFSANRIIPDLVKSVVEQEPVIIRNPLATRPWQHVLEPISGYLQLGMELLLKKPGFEEGWNFGPALQSNCSVERLVDLAKQEWGDITTNIHSNKQEHHEAHLLMLDCSKAAKNMHWEPIWDLEQTIKKTMEWYKAWHLGTEILTDAQIVEYVEHATEKGIEWAN